MNKVINLKIILLLSAIFIITGVFSGFSILWVFGGMMFLWYLIPFIKSCSGLHKMENFYYGTKKIAWKPVYDKILEKKSYIFKKGFCFSEKREYNRYYAKHHKVVAEISSRGTPKNITSYISIENLSQNGSFLTFDSKLSTQNIRLDRDALFLLYIPSFMETNQHVVGMIKRTAITKHFYENIGAHFP